VRLEIVTAPDVTDGGLADVLVFGHQATTPLLFRCTLFTEVFSR
jgi:hypothetical protein